MKIFRENLIATDRQVIELPWGHKILSAAPSRTDAFGSVDIWFTAPDRERNTVIGFDINNAPVRIPATERVLIHIAGTGHPIPEDIDVDDFIGTCVMASGLVWHVFARTAFDEPIGTQ